MSKVNKYPKLLLVVLLLAILWELYIFIKLPKQAFMQGLLESWLVNKGLIFYKDFGGQYLPFLRLLMIPLHRIFGFTQNTTILLAPVITISVLFVLFIASKRWLRGWFSLLPIIFFTIWQTLLSNNHFVATTFLGMTVVVSIYIWLSWWDNPTHLKSFLLGLFTAFSIFTLQIVVPFYLVLNLSLLLKFKKNLKQGIRYLSTSLIGLLVPTILIVVWFLSKGALNDLYVGTIKYHFTSYPYSSLGRETENIFIFLAIHTPLFLLFISGFNFKKISLALALFFLPLTFWFAIFHPLRFEISLPTFALIFGLALQDIFDSKSRRARKFGVVLLIAILLVNFYTIGEFKFTDYIKKLFVTKHSQKIISEVYPGDPMYDTIEWMKKNSNPEDKVFVYGDALFYVKSERLPANKRAVASEPFVFYPFDQFESEIKRSWPDFWVVDERLWGRYRDWPYPEVLAGFKRLMDQDQVVARFDYWTIRRHSD